MKIIVLSGGNSTEREVSLKSGAAVTKALQQSSYQVENLDYHNNFSVIKDKLLQADVIFPALHGSDGEDGKLQKLLEDNRIKYVGSNSKSSALCMDKNLFKQHIQNHVLTPKSEIVNSKTFWTSKLIQKPYVLKSINGGSSIDTFIIREPAKADKQQINDTFNRLQNMLLEELVEGVEITVGIIDNQALPVCEIIPPQSGEFDYENKYNGATQELIPPAHVTIQNQQQAMQIAEKVHKLCGCKHLNRIDMFVTADDKIYVIEANTLPGMTDQSIYPKEANAANISTPQLTDRLVKLAAK